MLVSNKGIIPPGCRRRRCRQRKWVFCLMENRGKTFKLYIAGCLIFEFSISYAYFEGDARRLLAAVVAMIDIQYLV